MPNYFWVSAPFYIPISSVWELLFLHILSKNGYAFLILAILVVFWRYLMVILICIFLMMLNNFSCVCLQSMYLFCEGSVQTLSPHFLGVALFSLLSLGTLHNLDTFIRYMICKNFLWVYGLPFLFCCCCCVLIK